MANRTDWLATRLADLLVMFQNVKAKIADYKDVLPLTTDQIDRIVLICDEFIAAYNYVEQSRATTEALVDWRDNIFKGSPVGDVAPAPPVYATVTMPAGSIIGIIKEFRDLRDLMVASPGYTQAIGEDLMIVAAEPESIVEADVTPDLKVTSASGYEVNIGGSMQGTDALRVEYSRKGGSGFVLIGFLTKLPGTITVTPHTPGEAEQGNVRGHFVKKNADFGNPSPEYPVTLS